MLDASTQMSNNLKRESAKNNEFFKNRIEREIEDLCVLRYITAKDVSHSIQVRINT